MRIETREYKVYKFDELSEQAQERALNNHIENNQYDDLDDYLNEYARELLAENNITIECDFKVLYDLSYSQGSGSQINGKFKIDDTYIYIKNYGHYQHEKAITYSEVDNEGNELETEKYIGLFQAIFKAITKEGYEYIEQENSKKTLKSYAS